MVCRMVQKGCNANRSDHGLKELMRHEWTYMVLEYMRPLEYFLHWNMFTPAEIISVRPFLTPVGVLGLCWNWMDFTFWFNLRRFG